MFDSRKNNSFWEDFCPILGNWGISVTFAQSTGSFLTLVWELDTENSTF